MTSTSRGSVAGFREIFVSRVLHGRHDKDRQTGGRFLSLQFRQPFPGRLIRQQHIQHDCHDRMPSQLFPSLPDAAGRNQPERGIA
jgi:hypothetical protein